MLVIASADPRTSDRALESLRMCVGLASGGHRVIFRAVGPARALRKPAEAAFPDWPRGAEYLAALSRLGGRVESDDESKAGFDDADVVIRWCE